MGLLVAASTATDTDWHAKLSDVAPDGTESMVRSPPRIGFPVSGSASRTPVVRASGARTRLVGVFASFAVGGLVLGAVTTTGNLGTEPVLTPAAEALDGITQTSSRNLELRLAARGVVGGSMTSKLNELRSLSTWPRNCISSRSCR